MTPTLEKWSITMRGSPFAAPETARPAITGTHPKRGVITTSVIITFNPLTRTIRTRSGSYYKLGKVDGRAELIHKGYEERSITMLTDNFNFERSTHNNPTMP